MAKDNEKQIKNTKKKKTNPPILCHQNLTNFNFLKQDYSWEGKHKAQSSEQSVSLFASV